MFGLWAESRFDQIINAITMLIKVQLLFKVTVNENNS